MDWRAVKRVGAATALAAGLGLGLASSASAIDVPNPIGGIGDAILDKVCPPRQPPYPASPGAQIVERGGGPGTYAQYGYAGLRWTTYDAGCLSSDKADTGIGSQINAMANSVDEVTNEMQAVALDPDTTTSLDGVIVKAVQGLREAFWNPWSVTGMAAAGLLLAAYTATGRATDALTVGGSALLVLAAIFTVLAQPTLPSEIGRNLTSGVASGVADSLVKSTPGGQAMPASAQPREKFTEGFYQVSYRAWAEGWSCGNASAEQAYGKRLLAAQAFSVDELRRIEGNPAAAKALVESKNKAWLEIGEQMAKTHPAAFGCWKGEGQSRMGAAVKHAVVTVSAGFWIMLGSIALLALKWVLPLAVLFVVAFGALMLFWRRMVDHLGEFVLLGLLGPPFVAAGVGTLLWGYYAILLDPTQSWWMAGVSAFALGLALFIAKGPLQRLFVGTHVVERAGRSMRRSSHRVVQSVTHRHGSSAGATVAGAAAGGVAGAAVSAAQSGPEPGDDARRRTPMGSADDRQRPLDTAATQDEAPAAALARARQMRQNGYSDYENGAPDMARTDGTEDPGTGRGWRQEYEGTWAEPEPEPTQQDGPRMYVAPSGTPVPTGDMDDADGWREIGRTEPKRHGLDLPTPPADDAAAQALHRVRMAADGRRDDA